MREVSDSRHVGLAVRRLEVCRSFAAIALGVLLPVFLVAPIHPAMGQIIEKQIGPAVSIGGAASFVAAGARSHDSSAQPDRVQVERMRRLTEVGARIEAGEEVERDLRQALAFYCEAARNGSTDALVRLGGLYANGRGVARDDAIAATLFRRAASFGSEIARQMSQMIQSYEQRLPDCLAGEVASIDAPVSRLVYGPRSLGAPAGISNPARFDTARPSTAHLKIAGLVLRLAREYRIDPRLVLAVVRSESNFDPRARSAKNALGLMQLIPETAERFAVANPLDPEQNLRGGMAYLRWLLAYFRGDVVLAVAGYNAGEGSVDRFRGVPPYAETMAYVQRIRAIYPRDRHSFDPRISEPSPMFAQALRVGTPLARHRAVYRVN